MRTCAIDDCEKPTCTGKADWCQMHYTRWWRHGSPLAVMKQKDRPRRPPRPTDPADVHRLEEHCELHVTRRDGTVHVILYDFADAEAVEARKWYVNPSNSVPGLFYARTSRQKADGKWGHVSMHILLMGRPLIDHINHNGLDNRRNNLCYATKAQNAANTRVRSDSKASQFKGVGWRAHAGKWVARTRKAHLGYFENEIDAARAYDRAAREEFGEYAYLNFPEAS